MKLMQGKKGLIMGVANDRSIAWGIAKKLSEHGAELAFTYVGDALKKRVIPLAESLGSKFTLDCNVEKKEEIVKTFSDIKDKVPPFSSTKSITGHSLGATSVQEAIYCLLMMKNKFIAASANVKDLDEKVKGLPIVTEVKKNVDLNCVMSNSFGFGGTNATLVFESI